MATKTKGATLLGRFLKTNSITLREAAAALGVSQTAIIYWTRGEQRPRLDMRLAIERWTSDVVPSGAWLRRGEVLPACEIVPWVAE